MTRGQLHNQRIHYQKQLTHHLLPEVDRSWLSQIVNCFLIRHPAEVIETYLKKNYTPLAADLGFPQQLEIFTTAKQLTGEVPLVIDASDILRNTARLLGLLYDAVGVPRDKQMFSWPPGIRLWKTLVEDFPEQKGDQPGVRRLPDGRGGLLRRSDRDFV
jgi:hypothetical protein